MSFRERREIPQGRRPRLAVNLASVTVADYAGTQHEIQGVPEISAPVSLYKYL
jgi:hypothetical protein